MRLCDLPEDKIVVGMRVRSLVPPHNKLGTIISIDPKDDDFTCILWDGDTIPRSGFYGNDCECEVVESLELKQ